MKSTMKSNRTAHSARGRLSINIDIGAASPALAAAGAMLLALALALAPSEAHAAAPLGRLFSTPAERAQLDQRRAGAALPLAPPAEAAPPAAAAGAEAPPDSMVLNGVVRRSSGRSTVWLNQVPQEDQQNRLRPAAGNGAPALQLQLPSGRQVILRAGQRYETDSGSVKEVNQP
ncbi:hypothetical protein ACFOLJ_26985 [Rugamonas sp. CCM 8940]|uniref:hypothetical protein n=1 Tax=Rugamonas sp. CCM 8940 TaxID=2765359 RepID=UPI0018F6CD48|nr:hypothetical protein [Rugamonas sp. CCM 8940]MBJ7313599.1 hypothetical protein [Rugamonas sp. CCM 8940]